ncbi:MAG: DUF642 domain-containing protein [Verrucomicrobiota bacterium]
MKRTLNPKTTILTLGVSLLMATASAQTPALDRYTINGGGGTSSNGAVALTGTIGQPYAGVLNSGTSTISSGIWGSLATDPPTDPQELIVNGSFENVGGTFVLGPAAPGPNGVMLLPVGSTTIPGWTVVNAALLWGNIDLNGTVLPGGAGTPFGHFYVDLTGWLDTPPFAGVAQTIATSPNQTYQLSFALGTVENDYRWRGPVSVTVSAGSTSNVFTYTPSGTDWQWRTFTWSFTAGSASTPITLTGASAAANLIALDNVSVSAAAALIISAPRIVGQALSFSIPANLASSYVIESRAQLTTGQWAPAAGTTTVPNGTMIQVTVPIPAAQPQQLYRVKASR